MRILGPVGGEEVIVDKINKYWRKTPMRTGDSADALADDGMAVGEGIDAMMASDAALNFGWEMLKFVRASEVGQDVAETEFGCRFGKIDVREPIHFTLDFKFSEPRHQQFAVIGEFLGHRGIEIHE